MKEVKGDRNLAETRLLSLDQFRGYTVVGMLLVNFVGSYAAIREQLPLLKHHNTYCSYADTIMPQFFFAVGYSLRLSLLRRVKQSGWRSAIGHQLHRFGLLLLVSFVVYHLSIRYKTWQELVANWPTSISGAFHQGYFQTLTHIAFTSLWLLPVAVLSWRWRFGYLLFTTGVYYGLLTNGYYEWVWKNGGIDGGPLGFLSWSIPALLGTFAYDMVKSRWRVRTILLVGFIICLIGYGLAFLSYWVPPNTPPQSMSEFLRALSAPFAPPTIATNLWTMSQKTVTLSYTYFSGGFSLIVFAWFVWSSDRHGWRYPTFHTFGTNALAAYILHMMVNEAVIPIFPKDSPLWAVFVGFGCAFGITWYLMRHLEKQKLILKL